MEKTYFADSAYPWSFPVCLSKQLTEYEDYFLDFPHEFLISKDRKVSLQISAHLIQ